MTKAFAYDVSFWNNKRVLLTGHTGFKGAWLAAWLTKLGAHVSGFSLASPSRESLIWQTLSASLVSQGFVDLRGDIQDAKALQDAIDSSQPDIVFHLAAQAIVLDSYTDPVSTWGANVMGTLSLLQSLATLHKDIFVIGVTSDKCYENKEWTWGYRENDPLGGADPYSASKAACEILLSSWRHSFSAKTGVRIASARAGNVIGGGDNAPHRIVPDLLNAFSEDRSVELRNPYSTRPYQHVLEPLSGYLLLARKGFETPDQFEQAYNLGPSQDGEKTTLWLAEQASKAWGQTRPLQLPATPPALHEAKALMLDSAKARRELQWEPTWNAKQAIEASVAWHKVFLNTPQDSKTTTYAQIEQYEIDSIASND